MAKGHESVELVPDTTVTYVAVSVLLAALTAVLAQLSIPLPGVPVPFSLQPFGVFFAGLLLGPVWGGFALLVYILTGLAGAPVFSNGGAGVAYFLGPTGGFLVGFLLAAVLIGAVVHRGTEPRSLTEVSAVTQVIALAAGLAVIYAVGTVWFAQVTANSLTGAASAMVLLLLPDVLKAALTIGAVAGGVEAFDQLR